MRLVPYFRKSELPSRIWPEASRIFEEFFSDFRSPSICAGAAEGFVPAVDILEKDGNLILRAELPGVNEKEIELRIEGNVLTLKGERKMEHEENRSNYHRVESFYGTFSRSFTLPDSVDRDKIKADYKNGILTVTVPQKPESKSREIPVSVN